MSINQGVLALANNNLIYPRNRGDPERQGRDGLLGRRATIITRAPGMRRSTQEYGVGDIHIAANGVGPEDEFSSYKFFEII